MSVRQEVANKLNPLLSKSTQVYMFMTECYGTVARVIARDATPADLSRVAVTERWKLSAP